MRAANRVIVVPCMLALLVAAALLTVGVVARYFLHAPTDWQEETSVLLLVGATFLSGAYVQEHRGHVAIDVLSSVLPPRLNRVRRFLADLISVLFCGFFAWKSWTLFHEAWVEGQTSNSTFAPPMWIPYGLMAAGMTLLTLQIAVQLLRLSPAPRHRRHLGLRGARARMSTLAVGSLYGASTLLVMFLGVPVAFALGAVAIAFMMLFMPSSALDTVTQNVYEEMGSITLLSIPLFILKGAAIGKSRAASDLYAAIHRWLNRVPGGLGIANVLACAMFAAMAGSSPATCSAVGQRRHPRDAPARLLGRLRRRPDRRGRHAGDPAAAVDHDDPVRRRRAGVAGSALSRRNRARAGAGQSVRRLRRAQVPARGARRAPHLRARAGRARPISTTSTSISATSCARCRARCRSWCCCSA